MLAIAAMVTAFGPTATASAASFHGYGISGITSGTAYSAIAVTRYDETIYVPNGTNCTTPFGSGSNPAYQTEWINDGAGNWLELGTGHQCNGFQYWYAGYGSGGIWYPVWTQSTGNGNHRFWIQGTIAGIHYQKYYTFNIDVTQVASVVDQTLSAPYDQTGLESYSSGTTAAAYTMTSLQYATGFSTSWNYWTGTTVVAQDPPLCARVYTATDVDSGENVSC